ncbi:MULTISPECIES: FecR family protein [Butyricimonas]|uniref:FecR family protein n=1 Tax=Butyricimonas TaxID=574697 RepID=UPI0007FB31FB|nr:MULTISPECIES: FecR family protein [Butyricimonas]
MEIEWKKIKRMALDEASEQEKLEVTAWKEEDERRERFYEDAATFYQKGASVDDPSREEMEQAWHKVWQRTRKHRHLPRRVAGWIAGAAVFVGVVFGVRLLMNDVTSDVPPVTKVAKTEGVRLVLSDGTTHVVEAGKNVVLDVPGFEVKDKGLKQLGQKQATESDQKELAYSEVIVPRGAEYQLTLADGTRVILNSESSIRFPDEFQTNERRVYLHGEAYFQVARDESCPFLVEAEVVTVKVLGTEFNVKAYRGNDVSTTLVTGRVSVAVGTDSLVLNPGQLCEMKDNTLTVREADLVSVLAWKNGEFVFKDVTLEEMMNELSRWYDMEIEYEAENLKTDRYYIYVERSKTLEEVLDKVALTGKIKYKIYGKKVILGQQQ